MLRDVLSALHSSCVAKDKRNEIIVLIRSYESHWKLERLEEDFDVLINEKSLNEAINEILIGMKESVLIVMSDLPLINADHIDEIVTSEEEIVIAPGRRGGTNILFLKDSSRFHVDYYGLSFRDHVKIASEMKLRTRVYDSFFTSTDIDLVDDLIDLYIHGDGYASAYLREIDVYPKIDDDNVYMMRER
jgi:2-phospho-L-lactate guanylyltransferase